MWRRSWCGVGGWRVGSLALVAMLSAWTGGTAQAQFSPSPVEQQYYVITRSVTDTVLGVTQSNIQGVRDGVQRYLRQRPIGGAPALAFSGQPQREFAADNPFASLAYAKATKGPAPLATAPPSYFISVWAQGSHDHERRSTFLNVTSTASTTISNTAVAGLDYVKIGVAQAADAFVIGAFGTHTHTTSSIVANNFEGPASTRSNSNGGGMYASYINGGFSTDFTLVITSTDSAVTSAIVTQTDIDSWNASFNMQYKWDLPANWWVEPTGGFSVTQSHLSTRNTTDGNIRRMQGGVRTGTEFAFGSVKVQPTLAGYVYSDVNNEIAHIVGFTFLHNNDKGYLWTKGVGKLNVQWTDKFSTSVEGEYRRRPDVEGYAGRVMARYTF